MNIKIISVLIVVFFAASFYTFAVQDDDDNPYDNSFLIENEYWEVMKMANYDVLVVDGLNQSEYLGDYYIPYFKVNHQALAALPVKRVDVQYLDPVNLTLNLGILKDYYGKKAMIKKNCSENNMNNTFEFIDLDTFYGNIQDINIEIFPIKYIDCEKNLATYYQTINYTLIFEEEPNVIKSFNSEITVQKNKNSTLNVEVTNITNGELVLKGAISNFKQSYKINNYNIKIPIQYNPNETMYLLQYLKDGRVIESHDVHVESVDFDFSFNATRNNITIDFDSSFENNANANITIQVIDRNDSLVFNKTENIIINNGESNYTTSYNFCKFCDLYVIVDINGFSFVKGINLAMYDDFVLSKQEEQQKPNNNTIISVICIIAAISCNNLFCILFLVQKRLLLVMVIKNEVNIYLLILFLYYFLLDLPESIL
jgi:hypothetical protein